MPTLNEEHVNLLSKYGLALKKELKASSLFKFNECGTDTKISKVLYDKLIEALSNVKLTKCELPDVLFGVELEFVGICDHDSVIAFNKEMMSIFGMHYFFAGSYIHNDGDHWILGKDSSIRWPREDNQPQYRGWELSSPILHLNKKEDIDNLRKAIVLIEKHLHGFVNKTCGTHIHISFDDNCLNIEDAIDIQALMINYGYMERKVFDTIVPSTRRKNRYCRNTVPYMGNKYQKLSARYCKYSRDDNKYNLRFEARQLEGTLDTDLIVAWAIIQSTVIYDLLKHIKDPDYIMSIVEMNILELLFHYDFPQSVQKMFIDRLIKFRSKALTT